VPAQDRGRGNREDRRPLAADHPPGQCREPEPVGIVPSQAADQLTAQHLVLVAQHQQLGVLGQIRADQHREQADQAPHQPVDERQQHPEMVPATPLLPQQTPAHSTKPSFRAGQDLVCPGSALTQLGRSGEAGCCVMSDQGPTIR
jgi:hypothetical protein